MFEEDVLGFAAGEPVAVVSHLLAVAGIDLAGVDLALLQPHDPTLSPSAWLDPDRRDLTAHTLIEMCVLACRVEAWAGAVKARSTQGLCRVYEADPGLVAADLATAVAATEIGCATAHSQSQVEGWAELAKWLAHVPTANTDFASGRLGWSKAAALRDCAADYSTEVAEAVYRADRDRAMRRTSSQMRVRWNTALAKADPDVMRQRAEHAHTRRDVRVFTRGNEPGMACLQLTGPAPLILTAKARLDDLADSVRAGEPDDARTLDAIRFDAAVALLVDGHLADHERGAPTAPATAAATGSTGSTGSTAGTGVVAGGGGGTGQS